MKLKTVIIIFAIFWIVLVVALGTVRLRADDIYNFYFQKAPGPTVVNQGGAGQTQTPAPSPNQPLGPQPPVYSGNVSPNGLANMPPVTPGAQPPPTQTDQVTTKVEKHSEDKASSELKHWELSFGVSSFSDVPSEFRGTDYNTTSGFFPNSDASEWTLGLQYSFSRVLGLSVQLMQIRNRPIQFDNQTNFDYAAGAVVTPFHFGLLGASSIDLGFIGGYMSLPVYYRWSKGDGSFYDSGRSYDFSYHIGAYYAGAKAKLNISDGFSIIGLVKVLPQFKSSQLTLAAAFDL